MKKIVGFPPIINKSSQVLIIGSMPGVQSLKVQEYYGNPRNQFWKIMGSFFGQPQWESYEQKKKMLLQNKIALWDVIRSCRREGSLDAHVQDVCVNDFGRLLKKYPQVKVIFCNGQKAFELFTRFHKDIDLPVFCLPSTSPAHTMSFSEKLTQWRKVRTEQWSVLTDVAGVSRSSAA